MRVDDRKFVKTPALHICGVFSGGAMAAKVLNCRLCLKGVPMQQNDKSFQLERGWASRITALFGCSSNQQFPVVFTNVCSKCITRVVTLEMAVSDFKS